MTAYNFPPDPWLRPAAERTCANCGRVLVGEDEAGMYYQAEVKDPETGIIFADRVHQCATGDWIGWPHVILPPGTEPEK